ncbi:hypothetical protein U9M48_009185 [Paspalum notatum var. saurae]|uniref:Uncharacterized protein n=1 Tax=Paspalum notatum var. saurae TaxID=547442 RepID=A0AAQ3SR73_PASNO
MPPPAELRSELGRGCDGARVSAAGGRSGDGARARNRSACCCVCMEPWSCGGAHLIWSWAGPAQFFAPFFWAFGDHLSIYCMQLHSLRACVRQVMPGDRWLQRSGNRSAKCPRCGKRFERKHITNLYAPRNLWDGFCRAQVEDEQCSFIDWVDDRWPRRVRVALLELKNKRDQAMKDFNNAIIQHGYKLDAQEAMFNEQVSTLKMEAVNMRIRCEQIHIRWFVVCFMVASTCVVVVWFILRK